MPKKSAPVLGERPLRQAQVLARMGSAKSLLQAALPSISQRLTNVERSEVGILQRDDWPQMVE